MANSNEDYLIKLMQNVCDKLDNISGIVSQKKDSKIGEDLLSKIPENQETMIKIYKSINANQVILEKQIIELKENIEKGIGNNDAVINNNQKKEYILFGNDTPFTSKFLLALITVILISSSGIKYIPGYLIENSNLKYERDIYETFYDYVYLDAFVKNNKIQNHVHDILNEIKENDSNFIKHFNTLKEKYTKEMQKQKLEQQLKQLK